MKSNRHPRIDLLIERVLNGDASAEEVAQLAAWRAQSSANEEHYRRTARLVETARALHHADDSAPARPPASVIAARAQWPGTRPQRRRILLGRVSWALAAAAALVLAFNIGRIRTDPRIAPAEVITGTGELATLTLADGTVVRLAPSSRLRIAPDRIRDVTLEGRAFFAVTHMADQPFRVHTRNGTANVLGTRFDLSATEHEIRLRVVEGRVALQAAENSVEVGAGEESAIRAGRVLAPTRLASTEDATGWLGRFLAFHATPLGIAAREIEQLYGVRVIVADSALAATTITATFTDRSIDQVIGVVCEVLSARCTTQRSVVRITR